MTHVAFLLSAGCHNLSLTVRCFVDTTWEESDINGVLHAIAILSHTLSFFFQRIVEWMLQVLVAQVWNTLLPPAEAAI